MHQDDSTREVACTLPEEQERERTERLRSTLVPYYLGSEAREDGLTVRFEGTDESLLAVAQFAANELQCCAFAEYEIALSPPYEETVLTITGPGGTRRMFRDGLVDRLEGESS